jgi:hypothetical protein
MGKEIRRDVYVRREGIEIYVFFFKRLVEIRFMRGRRVWAAA